MKIFLIIPLVMLVLVMGAPFIQAQSVPDWVKNTAGWWATDAISETEFVNAIEFLVNVGIINIEGENDLLIQTESSDEIRIAFLGDQGGSSFISNDIAVLNLVKNENVDLVLHQGDLGFEHDSPDEWDQRISDILGNDFL